LNHFTLVTDCGLWFLEIHFADSDLAINNNVNLGTLANYKNILECFLGICLHVLIFAWMITIGRDDCIQSQTDGNCQRKPRLAHGISFVWLLLLI